MCIACRQMISQKELLRIVKDSSNNIIIDSTHKLNGRGAYICKNNECLSKVIKQKLLDKTFKTNVSNDFYDDLVKEMDSL